MSFHECLPPGFFLVSVNKELSAPLMVLNFCNLIIWSQSQVTLLHNNMYFRLQFFCFSYNMDPDHTFFYTFSTVFHTAWSIDLDYKIYPGQQSVLIKWDLILPENHDMVNLRCDGTLL